MRTIEEAAVAGSRRARVVRDLRVLRRMLRLLRAYFVAGALVRRRYRRRQRDGEVFFVDEELGR
jgi:hypothetical protein